MYSALYRRGGSSNSHLRLVFTSDGVVVGVVIRRVERYDLVKIKPTESETEHCLCLRRLRSSENDSDFRFSLGHKLSYDSDYDSDSVASENQPFKRQLHKTHVGAGGWEPHGSSLPRAIMT